MSGTGVGTVLVVDDDPSLLMLCRVNLELDGYRVLEASTLPDARRVLERDPVDVVLLDVHVRGEDGRDLLRELRAKGSTPAVALFTGSTRLDAEDRRLADAVLPKPFQLGLLHTTVRSLIDAGRLIA